MWYGGEGEVAFFLDAGMRLAGPAGIEELRADRVHWAACQ